LLFAPEEQQFTLLLFAPEEQQFTLLLCSRGATIFTFFAPEEQHVYSFAI
jgi:hypothetical protein